MNGNGRDEPEERDREAEDEGEAILGAGSLRPLGRRDTSELTLQCDSANPCEKCAVAGLACTFDQPPTKVSKLAGAAERDHQNGSGDRGDAVAQRDIPVPVRAAGAEGVASTSRKRARSSVGESPDALSRKCLDPADNSHFFTSRDGLERFAGSTSGLPLLDAARRQWQAGDGAHRTEPEQSEPNWSWLSSLLQDPGADTSPLSHREREGGEHDDVEYFPGQDLAPASDEQDVAVLVSSVIPSDLLSSLVRVYFDVVHPVWPILYPGSFSLDLSEGHDYSSAAVVVAMCMLASRYSTDLRVLADTSVHFFPLFRQLRDLAMSRDNVLNAVQGLLLAARFHCVDNIPHAIAQALFAEAAARCLDGGLHRNISALAVYDSIEKQTRSRTAWACYIWDKQLAAICGRGPLLVMWDFDVSLPTPYEAVTPHPDGDRGARISVDMQADKRHCEVFVHHIIVTAVMERALAASMHRPVVVDAPLLNRISASCRPDLTDDEALQQVNEFLAEWRSGLPEHLRVSTGGLASSMTLEHAQMSGTAAMVDILMAARKLQLATIMPELHSPQPIPGHFALSPARERVLHASREMLNIAVRLGSAGLLGRADILLAFRVLVAGRMILAVLLSARSDGDRAQQEQAESAAQAVSIVLRHLAAVLPISLGAAEVFDETCRVCRLQLRGAPSSRTHHYAWYRPLGHRNPRAPVRSAHSGTLDARPSNSGTAAGGIIADFGDDFNILTGSDAQSLGVQSLEMLNSAPTGMPDAGLDIFAGFSLPNPEFEVGHMALPYLPSGDEVDDFSWLLPGGSIPYYVPE